MGRKKNNLVELLLDKVVLAIAAILALWMLFSFVIGSPNSAEYAGQKFTPGKIDARINEKAGYLQQQLNKAPKKDKDYQSSKNDYLALIADSLTGVNENLSYPLPSYSSTGSVEGNRVYNLPQMEKISNPVAAVVRMAGFMPTEELDENLSYEMAATKPVDVDLVTVESSINAKSLAAKFKAAFDGKSLPKKWRMPQYAKLVFAEVQLERRTLNPDQTWSDWQLVPRTKICHLKKTLELPKELNEYAIQIAMVQMAKPEIRNEILQPPVYDNAIPSEPWINPTYYIEREKRLAKEEEELKRQQVEAERAGKLRDRASRTRQTTATRRGAAPATPQPDGGGMMMPGMGGGGVAAPRRTQPSQRKTTRRTLRSRTETDLEKEVTVDETELFNQIMLTEENQSEDFEKLIFWAHDDTVEPGQKYQYRMRLGIFNPIVGQNWFSQQQKDLQNQIVLYTDYTEPTEIVEIEKRLCFFATDIRESQKGDILDRTVEVTVARYTLGNWLTSVFNLKGGEQIGTFVDVDQTRLAELDIETDWVDFTTGAVVVDARRVTQWVGTGYLRQKDYYELLYSHSDGEIVKVPIRERFWSTEMSKRFKEIEAEQQESPVALLTRENAKSKTGRNSGTSRRTMTPDSDMMGVPFMQPGF